MNRKVESYFHLAAEDLEAAGKLKTLPRQSAFHLQQSVEKILKAILTAEETRFPAISHNLSELAGCLPAAHSLKRLFVNLTPLSAYATAARYPTPGDGLPRAPEAAFIDRTIAETAELLMAAKEHIVQAGGPGRR